MQLLKFKGKKHHTDQKDKKTSQWTDTGWKKVEVI